MVQTTHPILGQMDPSSLVTSFLKEHHITPPERLPQVLQHLGGAPTDLLILRLLWLPVVCLRCRQWGVSTHTHATPMVVWGQEGRWGRDGADAAGGGVTFLVGFHVTCLAPEEITWLLLVLDDPFARRVVMSTWRVPQPPGP